MIIRLAAKADRDGVARVHRSAFPEGEGDRIARLALDLMEAPAEPSILSLVAETDTAVVGHVAFSPVMIAGDEGCRAYILAPLAVRPDHRRRRLGSALVEAGMARLAARGVDLVLVYGDPQYYARFGFSAGAAAGFRPPYELAYPFGWQAVAFDDRARLGSPVAIDCVRPLCDPDLW